MQLGAMQKFNPPCHQAGCDRRQRPENGQGTGLAQGLTQGSSQGYCRITTQWLFSVHPTPCCRPSRHLRRDGDEQPSAPQPDRIRSEEHTSELQSLMRISYAVFCLKKKKHITKH